MTWLLSVIANWRRKPRARVLSWDLFRLRTLAIFFVLVFGLIYGGFSALFGFDRQGNRWLGFAALAGGCVLLPLGVIHLMRPVKRLDDDQAETRQDH